MSKLREYLDLAENIDKTVFLRLTKDPDTSTGIKYELDDLIPPAKPKATKAVNNKTYELYYLTMKGEMKGDKYWYLVVDGKGEKAFYDDFKDKVNAKSFLDYLVP